MQTTQDKVRIDRIGRIYGLPPTSDPAYPIAIGGILRLIELKLGGAEDFFRSLLMKCEPAERRSMYEALRPHLPFQPKPLDVYLSECGDMAERKQLPTITEDGGLAPYRVPEINTESLDAAIAEAFAKKHLELVCRRCTKVAVFHGKTRAEAIHEARMAGWTYGVDPTGEGREICPTCPAAKN